MLVLFGLLLAVSPRAYCCIAVPPLPAPEVVGSVDGYTHLRVHVREDLALSVLEASLPEQERLVEDALEQPIASAGSDPYGLVLWPAAQVVAAALIGLLGTYGKKRPARVVELGAGTGLCSLAAVATGHQALATDYREEPLALLRQAAALNENQLSKRLPVDTALLDFTKEDVPEADVVVAADLLYLRSTSQALAAGCLAALRRGAQVLVGDTGRPGRPAFLDVLKQELRGAARQFRPVQGWSLVSPRHELISTSQAQPRLLNVGLLHLTPADLENSPHQEREMLEDRRETPDSRRTILDTAGDSAMELSSRPSAGRRPTGHRLPRLPRIRLRLALLAALAALSAWSRNQLTPTFSRTPTSRRALLALAAPLPAAAAPAPALGDIPWDEPKRKKTPLPQLAEEFTRAFQRTQWGVNGRVEPRYFSDSFVFRDPDVTTNGIREYAKGTGTVLSGCKADAVDVQIIEPDKFAIRWRIEGTANVPFPGLKIKPYIVTSTFTVNENGLVDSETDAFSIPTWDILLSALTPGLPFLAPPEPPVASPFA
ncbi:C42C1.13 [Symbiodinium necroappetens]|uniref:C42C1.13 protein n=1 Tax=Symbiodinium necroappetens TaxID=1628268 RepID=A0A812VFL4_9DINO|nr:C42C1.13 [Symbiodinium necroappetens]